MKSSGVNFCAALILVAVQFSCKNEPSGFVPAPEDWAFYQGGPDANQYTALDQITPENVAQLRMAWTYDAGDRDTADRSQIQCNPLIINGVLYGTGPKLKLFALDAATGAEKWVFDPYTGAYKDFGMGLNRGLAYWAEGADQRILFASGSMLMAVNAQTGKLISSFGKDGRVDLYEGLGRDSIRNFQLFANTPGVVYKDLYILGMRVSEATGMIPGHIRAFDIRTGKQQWIFHTIPHPGELGHDTWPENAWQTSGGANSWAGMSIDQKRGIVFVPTGSASFDFYGGDRPGQNLYANSLLALNAATGERIWHFQTVHHDLWDRDLPCPPNLVTIKKDGKTIDAVAQVTKNSFVFLFDRATGEPVFPIEEKPQPVSTLEGETTWPTQPIPSLPERFSRSSLTEADLSNRTPEVNAYAKSIFYNTKQGDYEPLSDQHNVFIFPGFDGGGEWGGAAADPETGILYINASEMPWVVRMNRFLPEDGTLATKGQNVYSRACIACHGKDLHGGSMYGNVPALANIGQRLKESEVLEVINKGRNAMPGFGYLSDGDKSALLAFLFEKTDKIDNSHQREMDASQKKPSWPYPYSFSGYTRFVDQDGYPAITPPWGTLNAIDLNSGKLVWKVTLGHHEELSGQLEGPTGTENYGGPVVTKGGLIFIAATKDEKIRAFEKTSGKVLWEAPLPAAGYATPSVYAVNGKQYVVIACGGGKIGSKSGSSYVAFALE